MRKTTYALAVFLIITVASLAQAAPKYRAWHIADEAMEDVVSWDWSAETITTASYTDVAVASFEIMLYSPLSDKNAVKIAEADFIKYKGWIFEVTFGNGNGWRLRKAGTTNYFSASTLKDDTDQVEVVGNAYANPGIENTRKLFETLKLIKDVWKDLTVAQKQTVGAAITNIETVLTEYEEAQQPE